MNKIIAAFLLSMSVSLMAAPKTLIKYKGGKVTPGLAKSAKKVSDGKYEFRLDTAAKVKGKLLTPAMVKSSLEPKLKKFKAKVAAKGASGVVVTYSGDESGFLKKVSKVKIKAKGSASLALDTSVSDGGLRAKTAARAPSGNEVKGKVVSISGDKVTMIVTANGGSGAAKQASPGKKITVSGLGSFKTAKGSDIFYKPKGSNLMQAESFSDK